MESIIVNSAIMSDIQTLIEAFEQSQNEGGFLYWLTSNSSSSRFGQCWLN